MADYVTKDYEGFRQLMIDLIPKYMPEWTDTSQSDFGIGLIELLANGLDVLSYYQDKNFNEAILPTARTRKSVVNLCRMLGYELAHQTPAIHKILFKKDASYLDDEIVIPKGTKVSTDPKIGAEVVFELLEGDVVIPSGVSEVTSYATHGTYILDNIIGASDGTEFQIFKLLYPDVLKDTLQVVTVENGRDVVWTRVEDFLSSEQQERHYTISTNEYNEMFIHFGNGLSGMIPLTGCVVKANYRVGGGEIGNVGLSTINTFSDTDFAGVTLKNIELYLRGEDVEDIEHAKKVAPSHFRNSGRAVTKTDFEDVVMSITGVSKAKCIETFNENGDLHIYVAPTDFGTVSEGLKTKILDTLNKVKLVHDKPIIKDAVYSEFSVNLNVITYSDFVNSDISAQVEEAIRNYFDLGRMDFGDDVFISNIVGEVIKVAGVRNVIVNSPVSDITIGENSISKLIGVSVVTTGGI